jgi:hypothetical protein
VDVFKGDGMLAGGLRHGSTVSQMTDIARAPAGTRFARTPPEVIDG